MTDQWASRDLPVLVEVVTRLDEDRHARVTPRLVAEATGRSVDDVTRAGLNLLRAEFVEAMDAAGHPILWFKHSPARRCEPSGPGQRPKLRSPAWSPPSNTTS